MNIAVIGYRGTGKTEVSKLLAESLDKKLLSTDNLIIEKHGDINKIVKNEGWDKFRDYEEEVIQDIVNLDDNIIDCGGGIIERDINIKNLKSNSKIILLTAKLSKIIERIEGSDRPSLSENKSFTEEVEEILKRRKDKYNKAANLTIDTTNLTIPEVVNKIIENG